TGVETPVITSQIDSTTLGGMYLFRDDATNGHASLRFKTYWGWPTATMQTPLTLQYNGFVGIGTTAPWQRFSVLGAPGNREGVSIAGEGNTWVYTDLNLTPVSASIA